SLAGMIQGSSSPNLALVNRDGNGLEYLLWVLLRDSPTRYRIEHVEVENGSRNIELKDFTDYRLVSF
ncbi:MAG TPA: hypothetical protein VNX25_04980, partial [Verrucomicrobiae bacterium]|nr:hypothetical protein [Verrucomicrobiae bacterium]